MAMSAADRLTEKQQALLEPLKRHSEWQRLMDKEIVALVLAGKADPREAADFLLARRVRKYA
jgi:hypothetical protein